MFIAGITQGIAEGYEKKDQYNRLQEEKQRRDEMFNMQKEAHTSNMEQVKLQLEQLKMQNLALRDQQAKSNFLQARDYSYKYLDEYYTGDSTNPKLLNTAVVQNPMLNDKLANDKFLGTNLGKITRVIDNDDDTVTLRNDLTGQEKTVPEHTFLMATGYFSKRDEVETEKAEKLFAQKQQKLQLMKAQTEISKNVAQTQKAQVEANKLSLDAIKTNSELQQVMDAKNLYKFSTDLANDPNAKVEDLNKVSKAITYNKELMDELGKDDLYTDTNKHLSLYDGASDLQKEVNALADGLMNDPVGTIEKFTANVTGYTMDEATKVKIKDANTLAAKMRLLTMDYLQYKSGAAFGEKELSEYEKVAGIAEFTDPSAAKAYMDGFVTWLHTRGKSKIEENTNSYGKVLLKARLENIDKYKDIKVGDTLKVNGKEAEVIGWTIDGKPKVKLLKGE